MITKRETAVENGEKAVRSEGTMVTHSLQDLDRIVEMSLLFDFYGPLLKDKNREIFGEYIGDNLSLGELSQQFGMTRQGIHDVVKRTEKTLVGYEDRLGLVARFKEIQNELDEIETLVKEKKLDPILEKTRKISGLL